MIVHNEYKQGDVDWMLARGGLPTASEFDNLISPTWKIRTGEGPRSYLAAKLAEKWLGGPIVTFNNWDMEQGSIMENEARPWLSLELDMDIQKVGFITTDDGRIGCSPDGIAGQIGIEIKCLQPPQHCKNLLNNAIPPEHLAQVFGGLFVTGFDEWIYCSYRRHFPSLIVRVKRDTEIMEKIHEALSGFLEDLDAGYDRLCQLNGGPPRRRAVDPRPTPEPSEFVSETPT